MPDPLPLLIAGFMLGFCTSIPVAGPISILVLALGVENKVRTAFGVAVGGAVAEAIYAFLAFWGFSHYLVHYPQVATVARMLTVAILLFIGFRLLRKKGQAGPVSSAAARSRARHGFLMGFTISILNPTLILSWTAAAGLVVAWHLLSATPLGALPFSSGVCAGIAGWFALLLYLVAGYRGRFQPGSLDRLLVFMGWGVILIACTFGALFVAKAL